MDDFLKPDPPSQAADHTGLRLYRPFRRLVSQHSYEVDASGRRVNCVPDQRGGNYGIFLVGKCWNCGLPPPPLKPAAGTPISAWVTEADFALCPWFAQLTKLRVAQIVTREITFFIFVLICLLRGCNLRASLAEIKRLAANLSPVL
jgi:hypothetical protein